MAKKKSEKAVNQLKEGKTEKPKTKKNKTAGAKKASGIQKVKAKKPQTKERMKETLRKEPEPISETIETSFSFSTHPVFPFSLFEDSDIELFQSGKHYRIYEKLGSHFLHFANEDGVYFAVWAPNALQVSVIGDFNSWNNASHKLFSRWDGSGIWEGFIPRMMQGEVYKYFIENYSGAHLEKGDPYSYCWELRPATGSRTWDLGYGWNDKQWMKKRRNNNALNKPFSVYEVHLGSWKRNTSDPEIFLTYREIAASLPKYCNEMGFTHVELMPVMEHPYDGSWGYQLTGYYAATSRYGTPQDLMFLIDELHNHNIGVILDWVPSHFPYDMQGLHMFDGTHLYEHADMRKGYHPDWQSYIFNSGRSEVKCFLISNAVFWFDKFHIDGIRVDAVASMLQLDYSRKEGEWVPNEFGGNENLENVALLKQLNETIYREYPDVQVIAEESSTWPGVTHNILEGGLGFGMKWMMGWMNDTIKYFKRDPVYRNWHQNDITFSMVYAFSENFMLPLSHDEVVHGKAPMIGKMPGDEWHRYANLRLLYTYMWAHPGSKLLFMGNEFAQTSEWNFAESLKWDLLQHEPHLGIQKIVSALNTLYASEPAMYEYSFDSKGFEWIAGDDTENCILAFIRKGKKAKDNIIVVLNMLPKMHTHYRIGVPKEGTYTEIFNSDNTLYWGKGASNKNIKTEKTAKHGKPNSIEIMIPPLGGVFFKLLQKPEPSL